MNKRVREMVAALEAGTLTIDDLCQDLVREPKPKIASKDAGKLEEHRRKALEQLRKDEHDVLQRKKVEAAMDAIAQVVRETKDLRILARIAGTTRGRGRYEEYISPMSLCEREPGLFLRFADEIVRAHAEARDSVREYEAKLASVKKSDVQD